MPMAEETDRHNVRDSDEFEALRNLYASYRFEIDNLWKRSSILSVFVGLFFVGYGQLALRMLDNLGNEEKLADSAICNALICGIAFVAIVFSVIWIMTAKASKGWQEVYEVKIKLYECLYTKIPYRFQMMNTTMGKKFCDCLLSVSAGRFSVSKINIMLGVVLLLIWCFILVWHLFFVDISACGKISDTLSFRYWKVGLIAFMLLFLIFFPKTLKSSKLGVLWNIQKSKNNNHFK